MAASGRTLATTLSAYLLLAAAPLGVAVLAHPYPGRGFFVELGVALGFVGFGALALQFALTAKSRWISSVLGLDTLLHFHRQVGLIAYGFILAHLGLLIAVSPGYAAYLDPRVDILRALALWTVLLSLTALIVTTLWREQLRIPYEWWRAGHGLLAIAVLGIGLIHILRVGWYISTEWKQAFLIAGTLGAFGMLFYARLWKPLRLRQRPWKVAEVRRERGDSWTLSFRPEGHGGMQFNAGQFVWLTLGSSPFSMDQHPFSISSSETKPDAVELTIKELGDYTGGIGAIEPGAPAYLDGPFGSFMLDPAADAAVFVAGGVGITPVMSILRTLGGRTSPAIPSLLIYGVKSLEAGTFVEELTELAREDWLDLVLVPEQRPDGWRGETGFIDPALLERHLPVDRPGIRYFVCGPEPLMDVTEGFLQGRGVPISRVLSERFNIA